MTDNKLKIEFASGCFDDFEGTQEELDELVAQITAAVESGELLEDSTELDENTWAELPDEIREQIIQSYEEEFNDIPKRTLQ